MFAILTIIAVFLLFIYVCGRGAGKTVAQVEVNSKKIANHVEGTAKKAVHATPEVLGHVTTASKAVAEVGVKNATRVRDLTKVGATVASATASQTRTAVRTGWAGFKASYQEQKKAMK